MDYLLEYNNFNNIFVKTFDTDSFKDFLYDDYQIKDIHKDVFRVVNDKGRIRYATISDLETIDYTKDNKYNNRRFIVLLDGEKIIGICLIQHYEYNNVGIKDEKHVSISYLSIDKNYRNKGYSKLMIKELVSTCKKEGFSLGSSSWTHLGNQRIRDNIKKECKLQGVEFYDNDNIHDNERSYKGGLHVDEINESAPILKDTDWFYLVIRGHGSMRGHGNKDTVYQSLVKMEFEGLRGISDNPKVSMAWFDVRSIMLIMPSEEVKRLNDVEQIEYFNPDDLVKNNLEKIRRILDNERSDDDYGLKSTITKMFQSNRFRVAHILGSKKKSRMYGTWKRDGSHKQYDVLERMFDNSTFYYGFGEYLTDKMTSNKIKVNSVSDISKEVVNFLETKKEDYNDTYRNTWVSKIYPDMMKHIEKYGDKYINQYIKWTLTYFGKVYNEREGEWIVHNRVFKVPENSIIYFKLTPDSHWDGGDEEHYRKWVLDYKSKLGKKDKYRSESHGFTEEQIKEVLSDYPMLKDLYDVRFVKHSQDMYDILKIHFDK